jgi:hypothetical protein
VAALGDDSAMNDEFPRPYSEEPSPAETLSGVRLLRTRPLAVLGTVLLTAAVSGAHLWVWFNVPASSPDEPMLWRIGRSFITELPALVPLIVIAALGGRRLRPLPVLALWGAAAVIAIVDSELVNFIWTFVFFDFGAGSMEFVSEATGFVSLLVIGLLARWLLPLPGRPAATGRDVLVLLVASLLLVLVDLPGRFTDGLPIWATVATSVSLWSFLVVGWSVAALVTSRQKASEWSGNPAELGLQDR